MTAEPWPLTPLRGLSSLQGALNNSNLADETRATYTQTITTINDFVQKAQPIIDAAKKKAEQQ
ncbi:MAG TPA: hypothetical protein VNW97_22160 [Candidatus Saccharimonadales bacterium]|nr:hypothetical protein [Candidatus Saccharimonadales bacterium]